MDEHLRVVVCDNSDDINMRPRFKRSVVAADFWIMKIEYVHDGNQEAVREETVRFNNLYTVYSSGMLGTFFKVLENVTVKDEFIVHSMICYKMHSNIL